MPKETPNAASSDTKTALLDAAERLFADGGIAASSLRSITSAAQANLASVNYHFGSKEGLARAVFARRLGPLNRARLDLLARCQVEGSGRADLGCLLHAFVDPAVVMMLSDDPGDREFVKLLGRTLSEPDAELRDLLVAEFREVSERFSEALVRVFPQAPRSEVVWRFHFMVGALAHTVAGRYLVSHRLECLQLPEEDDHTILADRLVDFLRSGWRGIDDAAAGVDAEVSR